MHDLSDTVLVQDISNGCENAFRKIYDRYHIQMFYIAKKYVKDSSLAEDVVQEIFVKVWEKRQKLDHVNSIKSYLFTMVRNHVLNTLRDRKSELISISMVKEEKLPLNNSTEEKLQYREYEAVLMRGVGELSGRKREVFELRTKEGLTNLEVAELLKIHVRTVKTHYYNSSKFIRTYLKNHAGILLILFAYL